jgi:hypothetical protein
MINSAKQFLTAIQNMAKTIREYVPTHFTGLADTPTGYREDAEEFLFVVPSGNQLTYDTVRFLENVSDAPDTLLNNGFLKLTREDFDAPWELEWSDVEVDVGETYLTGLLDTPTGYNSGYYLMSNETGVEYQSLTGLADRLIDYGFNTGTPILDFTGLQDTPPNYAFKQYLESTTDGLQYVNAHDLATTLGSIPKKYQDGVNFEGHLVNSGCDLYLVCNGQWIKYYSYNGILKSDSSDIPECVNTVEELALYEKYKEAYTAGLSANFFENELNGGTNDTTHNVCLFSTDSNSKVSIDETTYKWGLFNSDQTINLTALPGNGAGFSHWTGYGATFGDPNNQNTTTFVDKDLSITGVFNDSPTFAGEFDFDSSQIWDHRLLTYDVTKHNGFGKNVDIDGDTIVVTSMDNDTIIGQDCSNHINILFATSPIRYHTFIKNPNTNIFEQATLQTESLMVDGEVRSRMCGNNNPASSPSFQPYNASINILTPGRIVVNGNRMAVYLPYFTYFNRNLGHSVDSALETEYRAAWEKHFASDAIPTWDANQIQTEAVKIYEWTGSKWVDVETILPIFRARGNTNFQDGDIINTPPYLGIRCHLIWPDNTGYGLINQWLYKSLTTSYEVYPVYPHMDLEGDRLYIEGSTVADNDWQRCYDVAAIYDRQNNGSWTQSEYIDWELRVNNMFSVRRDYNLKHGCYHGKISGDYMIINEHDELTDFENISWYKKNNQGLWEIEKFLGLNQAQAFRGGLVRLTNFTLGFDINGDTLIWNGRTFNNTNQDHPEYCYFAIFDLKNAQYNQAQEMNYRSTVQLVNNQTNNIDIGDYTTYTTPMGNFDIYNTTARLNWMNFGFSNQVATNGEFVVAGWSTNANNRYEEAGTVFVYKRS